MKTLTFAVAIVTVATALHADALDDLLNANDCCTGPHDATALLTKAG